MAWVLESEGDVSNSKCGRLDAINLTMLSIDYCDSIFVHQNAQCVRNESLGTART